MSDILSDPVQVTQVVKTRASIISISNPRDGDPQISYTSEQIVFLNDKALDMALGAPPVIRNFSGVIAELTTITDPVTGQTLTVSTAGMGKLIEECYVRWFMIDRATASAADAVGASVSAQSVADLFPEEDTSAKAVAVRISVSRVVAAAADAQTALITTKAARTGTEAQAAAKLVAIASAAALAALADVNSAAVG